MSNELQKDDPKYTYFKIEFKNCSCFDFDYTIVPDLKEVMRILKAVEMDLDDDTETASVTITGIGMTNKEWREWQKENRNP